MERHVLPGKPAAAVQRGEKGTAHDPRQIGDDGVYRKVETSNYFVKSPASDDVLVISMCNNFADGE